MLLSGALSDPGLKKKHPLLKVFLSVVRIQLLFSFSCSTRVFESSGLPLAQSLAECRSNRDSFFLGGVPLFCTRFGAQPDPVINSLPLQLSPEMGGWHKANHLSGLVRA